MQKKIMTLVGMYQGISKKNENFGIAHFTYEPDKFVADKFIGESTEKLFFMGETYDKIKACPIGSKVEVSLYYSKKGDEWTPNVIDVNKIK